LFAEENPLLAEMKLRLYRNYSIKLMLAWETCCRSDQPSKPPIPPPGINILIRAALGSGILFSYPQLATLAGVQGVVVYALASALPLLIFAALGPIIRRKCPEGFVLTEWTRQRYGIVTALYLSFVTLVTLFLYMVSELSAIGQVVNTLTNLDGLPTMIVQCVVTTIYTCKYGKRFQAEWPLICGLALGGFKISFITDNIQGAMVCGLIVIATIAIGVETKIDTSLIDSSGLTKANLLGWQLLYILPVAVLTNDFFLSNFWLRTFASKTDKDLWVGVSIATVVILVILTLVGSTGLIAAWAGLWPGDPNDPADGSVAFFLLLEQLPAWVVGVVLVMSVSLSTASFDSLQSAMVSSASNDLFRNRLNVWWVRAGVVLIIIPVVVLALEAPSILQIYLISDLVSAATIPVLVIGLSDKCYWWRGFEVVVGGLGGIFTVFIFGTIYYGDALTGAQLILLEQGLYEGDWGAFGAFVAAPVGGLLWGFGALALRLGFQYVRARATGQRFDALDKPAYLVGDNDDDVAAVGAVADEETADQTDIGSTSKKWTGKFF
jgi:Na+/proline symporter